MSVSVFALHNKVFYICLPNFKNTKQMKIYLTLLILFLSEFVNATTIIKNGKLMYHAWTNEEKKPYATTDYREKSLYFNVQSDSLGNNWTIRIDDTDRTWAYVVRFASDIILLYVSENKNSENRFRISNFRNGYLKPRRSKRANETCYY